MVARDAGHKILHPKRPESDNRDMTGIEYDFETINDEMFKVTSPLGYCGYGPTEDIALRSAELAEYAGEWGL